MKAKKNIVKKNNIIQMSNYMTWIERFSYTTSGSTLEIHVNESSGEADVVSHNSDGEAISTRLSATAVRTLARALRKFDVEEDMKV